MIVPVFAVLFWFLRKRFLIARQARVARPPDSPDGPCAGVLSAPTVGSVQREDRAAVGSVGGVDRAAVLDGDLAHDRQAQPAALAAAAVGAAVEAVEHVRQVGLVDAGAVVAHAQPVGVDGDLDDAVAAASAGRRCRAGC